MQHILIPINHEVTNYVDDFAGGDDDPDILCDKLERFLTLMRSVNAKFSPGKIKVGFKEITCIGFVVSKSGYRPKQNHFTFNYFPTIFNFWRATISKEFTTVATAFRAKNDLH